MPKDTIKTIPDAYANLIALLKDKTNIPNISTRHKAHGKITKVNIELLIQKKKIKDAKDGNLQLYIKQFEEVKTAVNNLITPIKVFKKAKLEWEEQEVLDKMRSDLLRACSYDMGNNYNNSSYGKIKAAMYSDTNTYSNFNEQDFLNISQKSSTFKDTKDSPNLTKLLLEMRHKQETSKQTRELIEKPFITYNGIVLNSLTKDQLSIIKRLDDNLKKGNAASININLGVGEGKTFLIEVIQAVYGHDPAKRPKDITLKNGAKIGYSLQNNNNLFPSSNNAIFSLSLTDIVGDTKESLKTKLEGIKDAIVQEQAKGKKPLVVFDEFPHLNNDLKSLIRKTLPAECTTAYISATPNVIQLRNSKDPADRATEKTISAKKERFITGLQNNSHVVFEKTDVQQEDAFEALIRQTTEHLSGKQKAQWILPDLKPEHIRMFLENRVAQIQATDFQNIVFKNELGEIKYFNKHNELKDYPPEHQDDKEALETGSCLMVYSSQDAIGGDFDRLSENVDGQIISSINPVSTSQLQQWTARNRKRNGTMGEIDYTLIINAPDNNIDKFTQTLRVQENNHEKLDILGHLQNQIVTSLIQKTPEIPPDMPREIREQFQEKFGNEEDAKHNFDKAFKKECRKLIKNAIKDNVQPNVLRAYIDKGMQEYLKQQFGSSASKFSANVPTEVVKKISEPVDLYQSTLKSLNPLSIGAVNGGSGLTLEHLKLEKKVENYLSLKAQGTYNLYDNAVGDQQQADEHDKEIALASISKKINKIIATYERINNSAQGKYTHEKLFTDMDTINYALSVANTFEEDHPALGGHIETLEAFKAQTEERIRAKGVESIPAVLQPYAKKYNIEIPPKNAARVDDKAKKSPANDRMKNELNKLKDELESLEREIVTNQIKKDNPEYQKAIELVTKATKKLQDASLKGLKNEKEYIDCQRALNGLAKRIAGIDLKAAQQNLNEAIVKIQPSYEEIGSLQPDRNALDEPLKIAMNEVEPIMANLAVLMVDINPSDTQEGILKRTNELTASLNTITRHLGTLESGVVALRKAEELKLAQEAVLAEEVRIKAEEEARLKEEARIRAEEEATLNEMPPIEIIEGTTPEAIQGTVTDIPDIRETIERTPAPKVEIAKLHEYVEHIEPIKVEHGNVDPKVAEAAKPKIATIITLPDTLETAQELEITDVEPEIAEIQIPPQIPSPKVEPKEVPSPISAPTSLDTLDDDEELVAIAAQAEKAKQPQPKTINTTNVDLGEGEAVIVEDLEDQDDEYEDDFDLGDDQDLRGRVTNGYDSDNNSDEINLAQAPEDTDDDEPEVVNVDTNQNDEFKPIIVEGAVDPTLTPQTAKVTDNIEIIKKYPAAQTQKAEIHEQPITPETVDVTNEQTPDAITAVAQNVEPLKPQTPIVNPSQNFANALAFFKQRTEQQNGLDNMRGKTADATRVGNFLKARERFKAELQKAKDMVAAIGDLATLNNIAPSPEFAKLSTYVTRLDGNKRIIADLGNTDDYSAILGRSGELQNLTGDLRDYNKGLENILRTMQDSPSAAISNEQFPPIEVVKVDVSSAPIAGKITKIPDNIEPIIDVPAAQPQIPIEVVQSEALNVNSPSITGKITKIPDSIMTAQLVITPLNIPNIQQQPEDKPSDVNPAPIRKPPAIPITPTPSIPEPNKSKETSLFAFDAIMRLKKEASKPSVHTIAGDNPLETAKKFEDFCSKQNKKITKSKAISGNKDLMERLTTKEPTDKASDILSKQVAGKTVEEHLYQGKKSRYETDERLKHKLNAIEMYKDLKTEKKNNNLTISKLDENGQPKEIVKVHHHAKVSNNVKIDAANLHPDDRAHLLMVMAAKDLSKTGKINIENCKTNPHSAIMLYLFARSVNLKPNIKNDDGTLEAINGYTKDEDLKLIFDKAYAKKDDPQYNKVIISELERWRDSKKPKPSEPEPPRITLA